PGGTRVADDDLAGATRRGGESTRSRRPTSVVVLVDLDLAIYSCRPMSDPVHYIPSDALPPRRSRRGGVEEGAGEEKGPPVVRGPTPGTSGQPPVLASRRRGQL